jgi:DNA-binding Lrp family transcriptional regulator
MPIVFVFIECEEGQAHVVKRDAEQISGVQEAHSTNGGRYDVIVKVHTMDEHDLHAVLSDIRRIASITALAESIVSYVLANRVSAQSSCL